MKRLLVILPLLALLMVGCVPEETDYSPDQLYGKWVSGTEYYRFDTDMTGATWDTADDVMESEAQPFTWDVTGNQLTLIHIMEMGGNIPKAYTITLLTSTTLSFKDNYGQSFTYSRTNS